ncbi:universal stress protein [Loigolactobacillus bifermentans]|jgi:nucleotide-binding universal stress UspA family protein|uniref:universal stress protein n=1 Tax=Loigolactobacillus bifermentans TaxID=1607 RepID=UPI00070D97E0|nr:universal stress protein [Loigolactobacillus bifermentans]QGG61949.1 universal stress protein [Loigolactobacillus bifermentans]HAT53762.1 universal stress protein [Lactobacillus sp.]
MKPYSRILIGLDGSDQSDRAFKIACSLAQVLSASLYIVWIVNRDRGMDSSFGVNEDFYRDRLVQVSAKLNPYVREAVNQHINVTGKVLIGNIKTLLAKDVPDKYKIDLIVLGNTGSNMVGKMLQGSHSGYVIQHSDCDVLIIK